MSAHRLHLRRGREKSLRRHHPWVFSGAVAKVDGAPAAGETVAVHDADGRFLAWAAYSPHSQIRARAWSFSEAERVDAELVAARIARACAYRDAVLAPHLDARRLVHAESDGLPGVVADRYADSVVVQCLAAGAERWREAIADALAALPGVRRVYERSDAEVRTLEGLAPRAGTLRGDPPPASIDIDEHGRRYAVDVVHGQKTGFYLDQRDNRAHLGAACDRAAVLDVFCYTGGFSVAALAGGAAHVTAVDSSGEALARARANVRANGAREAAVEWLAEDAFAALRRLHGAGRRFDVVVVDPPKFAPTAKHVQRAARAYKDVNLWALKLLGAGGRLFTFSCSGAVDDGLFQSIVAGAALDAGREARIVQRLAAAPDHPVALNFPEAHYLEGLVVHVA